MTTPWERFKQAARLEEPDQIPVALIVDSPWLPGYAGIHTENIDAMIETAQNWTPPSAECWKWPWPKPGLKNVNDDEEKASK